MISILGSVSEMERENITTSKKVHLLTGIVKCHHCGSPMYINKNSWTNKDGSKKEIFYYSCGHNKACKGGECSPNSVRAEALEDQVVGYIRFSEE
jgi:hypothetical protein